MMLSLCVSPSACIDFIQSPNGGVIGEEANESRKVIGEQTHPNSKAE
jgi:hypothetical protein